MERGGNRGVGGGEEGRGGDGAGGRGKEVFKEESTEKGAVSF